MKHTIRVIFDDGDFLVTEINGTVKEIMNYYSGIFVDNNEKPRKVKLVTFI